VRHILECPVKSSQQIPESFALIQVSDADESEMFLFLRPVRAECKGVRIYKVRYDGHFIRVTDVCAQAPFQFRADTDDLACLAVCLL